MLNKIVSFFLPFVYFTLGSEHFPTVTLASSHYRFLRFYTLGAAFYFFAKWALPIPALALVFASMGLFFMLVALSNFFIDILKFGLVKSGKWSLVTYNKAPSAEPLTVEATATSDLPLSAPEPTATTTPTSISQSA